MRYDEKSGKLCVGVREFVTIARRGVAGTLPFDDEEAPRAEASRAALREIFPEASGRSYELDVPTKDATLSLSGKSDAEDGTSLGLLLEVPMPLKKLPRALVAEARGEAYALAYLALAEGRMPRFLRVVYLHTESGERREDEEEITERKVKTFFSKCLTAVSLFAAPEIERVTRRLPSMKALKFPYGKVRPGQDEMIRAAYRNLARGGTLYATAPTGTGKTVSVLFPAVRALGDGRCDKVFYFTPKHTTAKAAADCINRMCESGAMIRSVLLTAKEKICRRRVICRDGKALCDRSAENRVSEAALALAKAALPVADEETIRKFAEEYRVCPYELSLTYAELCDVVILDVNYLFDPQVYIRRFFTDGGNFAFLFDEAHNLPDRIRDMMSAEISTDFLKSPADSPVLSPLSATRGRASELSDAFFALLYPLLKEDARRDEKGRMIGGAHLKVPPKKLLPLLLTAAETTEEEIKTNLLSDDEGKTARLRALRDYLYALNKFTSALARMDDAYELFLFLEDEKIRAKVFCLDTGRVVSEKLEKGGSAVFFSGTLSPLDYYRSVLGGDRTSETLAVDSPFDRDQLFFGVMDKISTRFSERENSLLPICRVIAATVSARRGNYMIFTPSFVYAEALSRAFRQKYPKIRTLLQTPSMTAEEKRDFLAAFSENDPSYLVGFCVMGGIYAEGIDLTGDKLIGAVVVGIGMPTLSYEREAISAFYDAKYEAGKQYAYLYPGMNRVYQAAGRVIRTETDRGVIVLIDDRFDDPLYKETAPDLFAGMKFYADPKALNAGVTEFWKRVDAEEAP